MGAKMVAIRFLTLIVGLIMPHAALACLADDIPVRGELQRVEKRDPSGRLLTSYHIVLRVPACLKISARKYTDDGGQVWRVQFVPYDTHPAYLDKLIGAQVAARGRFELAHAPWHTADAVLLDAELIGIFGSPHDDFAFKYRKKHHRGQGHYDKRPYGKEFNGNSSIAPDELSLSLKDRPYPPDYRHKRYGKEKSYAPYRLDGLRDQIIYFITETYLRFHHMPPHAVRRYYWPRVHYRGRPKVRNDIIVAEKFRSRQRWPDQIYDFDPESLRISRSRHVLGAYDVSFEFGARMTDGGWTQHGRHRVMLTLDVKRNRIQICREDIDSLWQDDQGRRRGLARAEIYPLK